MEKRNVAEHHPAYEEALEFYCRADFEGAINKLERSRNFLVGEKDFHKLLGEAYFFNFQYEKATESFFEFLKNSPDDVGARNDLGYALLELKRVREANEQLGLILEQDSDNLEGLVSMGKCRQLMGDERGAIGYYEKAVRVGVRQKVTYGWSNKFFYSEDGEGNDVGEKREDQVCARDMGIEAMTCAYGELIGHYSLRGERLRSNFYKVSYVGFKARVALQRVFDFFRVF